MTCYLKINITEVDYSSYPAIAKFNFLDAKNQVTTVVEKIDVLTSGEIITIPISDYFLTCKIIEETAEEYFVDISKPFGVLSEDNRFLFCVKKDMISNIHFDDKSRPKDN